MRYLTLLLLCPTLLCAQEFQFQQETDTIPVEINGWRPYQPFFGGFSWSTPDLCDIDTDGDLDLFVGQFANIPVSFFRNIGTIISPYFKWELGLSDSLKSIDLTNGHTSPDFFDLDEDGDLDCLVGGGYVTFTRNLGTATQPNFISLRDTLFDTSGNPVWGTRVALTDIDADGDGDLITGVYPGYLRLYRNVGTPDSFAFFLEQDHWLGISVGAGGYADPTFCDIDADGDYDLFIGEEWGKIWFYRNNGTPQQYNFTYVTNNYAGIDVGDYSSPEFADVNGDGDYDLLVGRAQEYTTGISPGDIFYYENTGTPQVAHWNLVTKNYLSLDVGYTALLAMTDIDADGDLDLFIENTGDHLSFYRNVGTPDSAAFQWVTDSYQNIAVNDAYLEFGDIDADGDPDLFMGQAAIPGPPSLYLFINQGTPQAASFVLYSSNYLPGVFTQNSVCLAPTLADINADGDLDLFISDTDGLFYYFQNNGSPTNPFFVLMSTTWQGIYLGSSQSPSCFYDIDQDGDLDLFLARWNGWNKVWFYRNIGTAQNANLVLETQTFLGDSIPLIYSGIEVVDIDQDGDGDIFLAGHEGGMVFFRNVTGETLVDPRKRPVPTYPKIDLILQPNPGNSLATITFTLPTPQEVSLAVYNILGGKVATLVQGLQPAGNQVYRWQPLSAPSGVYLVRLATPTATAVKKLALVK